MFILHSLIFRTYSNTFTCPVFRPFSSRASTARNVPVRPTPALRGQNDVIMVDVIIVDVIIAKDPECNTDSVINSTENLQPVNCLAAYLQWTSILPTILPFSFRTCVWKVRRLICSGAPWSGHSRKWNWTTVRSSFVFKGKYQYSLVLFYLKVYIYYFRRTITLKGKVNF